MGPKGPGLCGQGPKAQLTVTASGQKGQLLGHMGIIPYVVGHTISQPMSRALMDCNTTTTSIVETPGGGCVMYSGWLPQTLHMGA